MITYSMGSSYQLHVFLLSGVCETYSTIVDRRESLCQTVSHLHIVTLMEVSVEKGAAELRRSAVSSMLQRIHRAKNT